MDAKTLEVLAARCEAAQGADRELDCLIHCAVKGWEVVYEGKDVLAIVDGRRVMVGWIDPGVNQRNFSATTDSLAPRYTSSLDAAMGLVPEGWAWVLANTSIAGPFADLTRATALVGAPETTGGEPIEAATPALALCAAALRALATKEPTNV